ncbi:MAG: SPOR domain-containing protein [Saprospiraceae bacterium]|nr:SPOR domain-containing protein [Candidatus Opimibacter iunctus]
MKSDHTMLMKGLHVRLLFAGMWLLMSVTPGKAQLVEDPQIASMMNRWKTYNTEHQEVRGYRIQIMASVDRRQIESTRRTFENRYPEYPIVFLHNEPYFHLKVGAFLTMQKAQAFLKKMQHDYPQAIPVTDNLKVEELLLYDQ